MRCSNRDTALSTNWRKSFLFALFPGETISMTATSRWVLTWRIAMRRCFRELSTPKPASVERTRGGLAGKVRVPAPFDDGEIGDRVRVGLVLGNGACRANTSGS